MAYFLIPAVLLGVLEKVHDCLTKSAHFQALRADGRELMVVVIKENYLQKSNKLKI